MQEPKIKGAYLAPNAVVIGDVTLGEEASVWYGAILRGDSGAIRVGRGSNIQDRCVLHEKTTVGENCTVGHGAIVHGCTIGNRCLIGMGAILLNDARIGDDCIVAAGALVTGKMDAPAGSLILGNPAKVAKPLTAEQLQSLPESAAHYIALAREQLEQK